MSFIAIISLSFHVFYIMIAFLKNLFKIILFGDVF